MIQLTDRHSSGCSALVRNFLQTGYPSDFHEVFYFFHLLSYAAAFVDYQMNGSVKEPNISNLDIFLFSTHHSIVSYFRCSVYWWKGSVRF